MYVQHECQSQKNEETEHEQYTPKIDRAREMIPGTLMYAHFLSSVNLRLRRGHAYIMLPFLCQGIAVARPKPGCGAICV